MKQLLLVLLVIVGPFCSTLCADVGPLAPEPTRAIASIPELAPHASELALAYSNFARRDIRREDLTLEQVMKLPRPNRPYAQYTRVLGIVQNYLSQFEMSLAEPSTHLAPPALIFTATMPEKLRKILRWVNSQSETRVSHDDLNLEDVFEYCLNNGNLGKLDDLVQACERVDHPLKRRTVMTKLETILARPAPTRRLPEPLAHLFPSLAQALESRQGLDPELPLWQFFAKGTRLTRFYRLGLFTLGDLLTHWEKLRAQDPELLIPRKPGVGISFHLEDDSLRSTLSENLGLYLSHAIRLHSQRMTRDTQHPGGCRVLDGAPQHQTSFTSEL